MLTFYSINNVELRALKDLFKVSAAAALRLPLHLSATMTPLILLIPISLTGTRDKKMDILSVRLYMLHALFLPINLYVR
jgi:hypothetical protein